MLSLIVKVVLARRTSAELIVVPVTFMLPSEITYPAALRLPVPLIASEAGLSAFFATIDHNAPLILFSPTSLTESAMPSEKTFEMPLE